MNRSRMEPFPAGSEDAERAWPHAALLGAAFFTGYLALDWLSFIHPMRLYGITPWNPQPALAVALLMVRGRRWLAMVLVTVLASEWIVRGAPAPWPATLLIGFALAAGYAVMATLLTGRLAINPALETQRDAVRLVAVIAVGALLTGLLYVGALLASGLGTLDRPAVAVMRFWIGDAVGILVTLPFVLLLTVRARRHEMGEILRRRDGIAHLAVTVLALALVFSLRDEDLFKYFYVLFLPLVFIAARTGLAGSILAALAIQGAIIASGQLAQFQTLTVFELQALLMALTVTGLFLGVVVDERRRAEKELARSMRLAAAGEMAAALAHELNQPLTAVSTYARAGRMIAQSTQPDRGLLVETLDKLVDESSRAAEVVRRLRDFFRTGATKLAPVSLERIAARVVASAQDTPAAAGAWLELRAAPGLPELLADDTQLEVVLRNLVANALEAAATGRRAREVVVELEADASGMATVTVRDSGPGVAEKDVERIFEPFETTRASGMGMGLAISRAIVEAHGGRLWAEAGDRGLFRFTLPAQENAHG